MKAKLDKLRSVSAWLWEHTAAGVGLLLIIMALVIGYHWGRPTPEQDTDQASSGQVEGSEEPQMYTCSMHSTVRLPDPKAKCPICFMDLIPVSSDGSGEGGERRIALSEAAVKISEIETAPVGRFFPRADIRLFGKITYDETSVARLTAYFPGRIERLFVNYVGVPVQKGDHLAELYSPELLTALEELRQARQAKEAGSEATALLRKTTKQTLDAAREKLRLYGLTEKQVEDVESGAFKGDRLTVYAPIGGVVTHLAARDGDYLDTGEPIATVANLSRLWVDLEAYESQLPLLAWGQTATFTVESHPGETFEGRIAFIEPMVDNKTRTAAVRVAVDNTSRKLKPGMFASAVVKPRVGADGAVLSDELAGRWVSPMHPTIVKDGPGNCDICGMDLVTAESLGVVGDPTTVEEPLVIPRSAVLFTGIRSVVYVKVMGEERPTFEGRQVELGPRAGEFYTVRSGLREGDLVVVKGAFRVDSAMQIVAKPSMMMPEGGGGGPGHQHGGHNMPREQAHSVLPEEFIFSLKPVYAAYLDSQEALAADDLGAFVQAAEDLSTAIGFVEQVRLVGEPLGTWRRAVAKLRFARPVTTIDEARNRLEKMSQGVIALQRAFGHRGSETWSIAFCPMAFDDKGAEWLQRGDEINNPYFGASMLRCGEFRDTFPPLNQKPTSRPADENGHAHEHGKAPR